MDEGFEEELIGRTLGGTYRVERRLGSGGMGAVFRATHLRTSRPYAVKVLLPEVAARRDAMQRFRREAEAVGALGHANVVAVHDFDVADGWAYLVMDLLEGEDLSSRIERSGRLSLSESLAILEGVAAGLGAAHERGMVHRDLKPANIFLARQPGAPERAILLDFGLAKSLVDEGDLSKLTATGVVMGTPQYMSPEQASGYPLDERADLYSLATIFYEMLSGRVPFSAPSVPALFAKLATDPAPPIDLHRRDLPPALTSVLARALAKSPAERYPSAAHLVSAVRDAARLPAAALPNIALPAAVQPAPSTPVGNAAGSWPRGVDPHGATQATPADVLRAQTPVALPSAAPPRSARSIRWWPVLLVVGLLATGGLGIGGGGYLYWRQVQQTGQPLASSERSAPRAPAADPFEAAPRPVEVTTPEVQPLVATPPPEPPPVAPEVVSSRPLRPRGRRRASRQTRPPPPAAPPPEAPSAPPSPPPDTAAPPTGAEPPSPPAGVQESVAFMASRDFAGCIRESRRHPRSIALLGTRLGCAIHAGDDAELQRTCAEIRQHYPGHAYNQTCESMLQSRGVSP